MTEQKNDSKVILKIVVTEDEAHIEHHIHGLLEKAQVVAVLDKEIADLAKEDRVFAKSILGGLISNCGITKDDFDKVQKMQKLASGISKLIIDAMKNTEESGEK
ncbi:hypothetical protein [Fructilactobacillus frigidiflavus]|uniref:hypothetical protein n=1 Tax=Fructilactobacillus frigidiflavus TaxID=3242688 RepID=UPI0037566278